ncbi:winged helix-turn-helix domain-containing protein [Micromonospora sp. MA102]|uniref:winged helix-turn-helix domain-containing protein n=1 Tax=Micromonospora sp. MA102 TaxID=2952755 RepID=UPI0021C5FC03|nr:winged helix-turn-helix domain-containing protein [Micromonospora sp. MA102]
MDPSPGPGGRRHHRAGRHCVAPRHRQPRGRQSPSWSAGSGQRRIADELAAKIRVGELDPDDTLPATRALAEAHGVHMNMTSRAVSLLHGRELITGRPGRGTYVAERPGR